MGANVQSVKKMLKFLKALDNMKIALIFASSLTNNKQQTTMLKVLIFSIVATFTRAQPQTVTLQTSVRPGDAMISVRDTSGLAVANVYIQKFVPVSVDCLCY